MVDRNDAKKKAQEIIHTHYLNKITVEYPIGHYYSPYPNFAFIKKRYESLVNHQQKSIAGVNLNLEAQLALADELKQYQSCIPFPDKPQPEFRYYLDNGWFSYTDACVLFGMLRHRPPKRIIEVGSGYSSALMLDTNEHFLNNDIELVFIEPDPYRLHEIFKENDRKKHKLIQLQLQDVELEMFDKLNSGDWLFIDSSHVTKFGSDVNRIFFEILPRLKPGVMIHFHDVYWPFENPKDWLLHGRLWNEVYLLRGFLQYNTAFSICFFNAMLDTLYPEIMRETFPLSVHDEKYEITAAGSSIWLRKN
ncbi:class I SAM-dependent methyltransferase [Teredinibacter sp. KSP-S5-2]|uniref:class I SAM-dependent methyltransferase n=1 Tax=Teredinibacter sp. KSP-S5-2 TaxID=3034506 RepID=UPI0029351B98|nr:class I SAM-dependent methyltransferase [Teredinibacter sp. KSP-S5-2]WNO11318.1 class I SAM-dependent methyltransferase [Teredinibacter sp. KSP-S5-2]